MIEEINKVLIEFSKKYNLQEKAIKSCQSIMQSCIDDDVTSLGGFSIYEIRLEYIGQQLIFDHFLHNMTFVKTRIGLYKKKENNDYVRNLEPIGYYELDTDIEGEFFDDWLSIDLEKNNELDIIYELQELNEFLPETYLRSNSIYYEYVSYVAQIVCLYQSKNYIGSQLFIKRAFEFLSRTNLQTAETRYFNKSKNYIRKIAQYMEECNLIHEDMFEVFNKLEVLKRKTSKTFK